MAGNCIESGRTVTSKITSILLTFTEGNEHSLTEIARLVGLPVSTTHRLATELASCRLLERTPYGQYRAGTPLRMIGAVDPCTPTIVERAPCVLEDLAAATKSRARIGVLQDLDVAYIEKRPGPQPATSFNSRATLPAHPTALGRSMLAFSPIDTVERTIKRGLKPYTPYTVTSPERFRRALAITRLTRVAVIRWELEANVCGVAMPVFGPGGNVIAAIELIVDTLKDLQPSVTALTIASRSLSRELFGGARPTHPERLLPGASQGEPVPSRRNDGGTPESTRYQMPIQMRWHQGQRHHATAVSGSTSVRTATAALAQSGRAGHSGGCGR